MSFQIQRNREMDFQSMKRKQLQSLCKKHGIPANKTNLEMARLLAATLKASGSENAVSENNGKEEDEVVVDSKSNEKKPKKVRFSPDVETREYEPSVCKGRGGRISRRRSVADLGEKRSASENEFVNNVSDKSEDGLKRDVNRRRLRNREVVDDGVGKKKRRIVDVNKENLGEIQGRVVTRSRAKAAASEGLSEFGRATEGKIKLGKEVVKRSVSRRNSVVPRKDGGKKTRKQLGDVHLEEVGDGVSCMRSVEEIDKVSKEIGTLRSFASATDGSESRGEIGRMEQLDEEEASGDNEDGCDEALRPCGNDDVVGNVVELKEKEKVVPREESTSAAEAALTEGISLVNEPIQDTKLVTPEVTRTLRKTKVYKSRSNRKVSGDVLDGLSDVKENFVEENQNLTPAVDDRKAELARSQTTPSNVICPPISFSSANQSGLEKVMEVEEMSRRKETQHESHDFNDHLTKNDRSFQLDGDFHSLLHDIEAQDEPRANSEVRHNESDALGRTLDGEEICCTVQERKENDRDIGFILPSDNNDLEQVELCDEKEGNNASTMRASEEVLHSQNFGDCFPTEIREESKDILDGSDHNACEAFMRPGIPEDLPEELEDHNKTMVLESNCIVDAVIDESFTKLPAPAMDVISSEDMDVDTHVKERTVQEEDLGTGVEIVDGTSHKKVPANTHSSGEPSFYQTICDGFEVSRMKIGDTIVAPNAESPTKTVHSENMEVQDVENSDILISEKAVEFSGAVFLCDNDTGTKEVAPNLNENADERMSQNKHEESGFSEGWSVGQSEEKDTESEFGSSKVSYFIQGINDNLIEGETVEKHGHCEDICEINGEAIDNGTSMESRETLSMQQTQNGSSSTKSPCVPGLLFPDEREEFAEIPRAATETLFGNLSEDSKDPMETIGCENASLEIAEKSGELDNLMEKNTEEMDKDMFVDPENVISENIKPMDARDNVEKVDDELTACTNLAEESTISPQALTSNRKQAMRCFTEGISIYDKSCGKSEKESIDTVSELKVLPFYEPENERSDVGSALGRGNEEHTEAEETTGVALQESSASKDYVHVMSITENIPDTDEADTIVVEKQLGKALLTIRDEPIHAGDEISNGLYNISAIKRAFTEGVLVAARVGDELNYSPPVDSTDSKGKIDASNDDHDGTNQLSEHDGAVNGGVFWSGIKISTPSELSFEDKKETCATETNEAPSLHKPNLGASVLLQNKETMDSFAVSIVNASHDKEQEVEKPDTRAQQLSLLNRDFMEMEENSKMNIETAGQFDDQHGGNVHSTVEEVDELKMCNSGKVSESLHVEEIEHSSRQDNLPLKVDEIQGYCSPKIRDNESVKVSTKKDDISGLVVLNEGMLSEDVPGQHSSVMDQSTSYINAAVGEETASELDDQHGENVHSMEEEVAELKMCSTCDESLQIEEIEHTSMQDNLPFKVDEIQGSCSLETHEYESVKVEPINSKNVDNTGLDVAEEMSNEDVPGVHSSAKNQSTSPINAAVGQGTGDENNHQSRMKLPPAEMTSLTAKKEQCRSVYAKHLISPALKSKHSRTVLIHGTPRRAFDSSDMKENIPSTKMQRAGNLTAQRVLRKRRPLEDLRKI